MKNIGLRLITLLVFTFVLSSCSEDPLSPFEPETNNATDSFQLQATGVRNVSTTLSYTWRNTGTSANVNHSTTTTSGSVRLVVRAANGAVVYDKALLPSLNELTATAAAGDWTVQVIFSNYSGTVNFRLQKP